MLAAVGAWTLIYRQDVKKEKKKNRGKNMNRNGDLQAPARLKTKKKVKAKTWNVRVASRPRAVKNPLRLIKS